MAKSKGTTGRSLIAMLKRQRAKVWKRALREPERDFSDSEQNYLKALDCVIAHTTPTGRRDTDEQVRVACEIIEVLAHDETAPPELQVAYAAISSAEQKLRAPY